MKKILFLLLTIFLIGLVGAQEEVEIGENITIDQDNTEINTTGEWNASNLIVREQETVFDDIVFDVESQENIFIDLDFLKRDVPLDSYVTNFSADTDTLNAEANFTYSNLVSGNILETKKNGDSIKVKETTGTYFFTNNFTTPGFYQNFTVKNLEDRSPPKFENVKNSDEDKTYSVNDPETFTLSADIIDTVSGLEKAYLTTNETREFRNYTIEYGGTQQLSGERDSVSFTWDNVQKISQDRDVGWAIWAQDKAGNWNKSKLRTFKIRERPIITRVTLEDVRQGDISQMKARVVDPTGFGDIVNVTFRVTRPGGQTHDIRAVRGEKISVDQYTGNVYTYNYTNTVDAGAYTVETIAYDETGKDSQENFFEVGPITELLKRLLLNPFYIGQSNIVQALFIIFEQQKYLIGGLLLAVLATLTSIKYTNEGITKELFDRIQQVRGDRNNENENPDN